MQVGGGEKEPFKAVLQFTSLSAVPVPASPADAPVVGLGALVQPQRNVARQGKQLLYVLAPDIVAFFHLRHLVDDDLLAGGGGGLLVQGRSRATGAGFMRATHAPPQRRRPRQCA